MEQITSKFLNEKLPHKPRVARQNILVKYVFSGPIVLTSSINSLRSSGKSLSVDFKV